MATKAGHYYITSLITIMNCEESWEVLQFIPRLRAHKSILKASVTWLDESHRFGVMLCYAGSACIQVASGLATFTTASLWIGSANWRRKCLLSEHIRANFHIEGENFLPNEFISQWEPAIVHHLVRVLMWILKNVAECLLIYYVYFDIDSYQYIIADGRRFHLHVQYEVFWLKFTEWRVSICYCALCTCNVCIINKCCVLWHFISDFFDQLADKIL